MSDTYLLRDQVKPLFWQPTLTAGADWFFSVRLTGAVPGHVTGAVMAINGQMYPVVVHTDRLEARLDRSVVQGIPGGAACQMYLDVADSGRVCWLSGTVLKDGASD